MTKGRGCGELIEVRLAPVDVPPVRHVQKGRQPIRPDSFELFGRRQYPGVERYEKLLEKLAPATEQGALIEALQAFRGIRLLTASAIAYELGDLKRFASPIKLMGFLGVVPSEDSSGDKVQRGMITKSGNTGLRRLLVESAWSYRFRPSVTGRLKTRAARVAPGVRQIAWKAQVRLHSRYKTMLARKKKQQKVLVALARELAGFVWAVGQERELLAS